MAKTAKCVSRAEVRRKHNASQRSMVSTFIKRVLQVHHAAAMAEFKRAQLVIDRVADKDVITKKYAARIKRSLNARIKHRQ